MPLPPDAPRLLAVDVDGTLLDSSKQIPPAAAAAIAALRAEGVTVVLATGRIPPGIEAICRRLGLTGPQVCAHGGVVADPLTGEVFAARALDRAAIREQLQFARELGVDAIVAVADGFRVAEMRPGLERLFLPYDEPLPRVVGEAALAASSPIKTYLDTGAERYAEVIGKARARFGDRYTITSPDARSVELLAPGVSKLSGLEAAAARLGLAGAAFAAVGDGPNDIALLEAAIVGVALGQAPPEVVAAADRVTQTNDRGGFAQALASIYGITPCALPPPSPDRAPRRPSRAS